MKNKYLIYSITALCFFASSCSKTKYGGFRQYTCNFFSYYNTYFNTKQLYKVGYRESVANKQESASDLISVFDYENDPEFFKNTSQFKNTTPKITKLLAKRPYNKWMDDAILIEGKIRYLQGDLDSAIQLLSYLVDYYPKGFYVGHMPGGRLKGFDKIVREATRNKEPISQPKFRFCFARNEGMIWLAKAFIKDKSYDRALNLIYRTENDMAFPIEYRKDLAKTKIMLDIHTKKYANATKRINILFSEYKLSKREKGRMYFLLGQLSEEDEKFDIAKSMFEFALSNKLRNDLEFEAKLRMLTYTRSDADNVLSKLKKMLNKGKYSDNLDKIYFAIGNVHLKEKRDDEAMSNFRKAITNSKSSNQKFIIFEKIGSIFYAKTNYVLAATYYDSAQKVIPQNYPNKKEFVKKIDALKRLLVQHHIFIENDSILELSSLGYEEAKNKIENDIKEAYRKEKARESFLESQALNSQPLASSSLKGQAKSWYFSEPGKVKRGRILFKKKWGKIKLKDNWHRANSSILFESSTDSTDASGNPLEAGSELSTDIVAGVEAKKLPFTDETKTPYIIKIQKALIAMARIYNYEIKDKKKAIETYELLFGKYGNNIPHEDEIMFSLYRLYVENNQIDLAEKYKRLLIAQYPHSKYSTYALNPLAKSQDEKSQLIVARKYKALYDKYQKAYYTTAIEMANDLLLEYPNHSLVPKVQLLRAFIYSYTTNSREYENTLQNIIAEHPKSEEAKTAKEYLDLFKKYGTKDVSTPMNNDAQSKKDAEGGFIKPKESFIQDKKESISQAGPAKPKKDTTTKEKLKTTAKPIESTKPNLRKKDKTIASNNQVQTADGLQTVNYYYKPSDKHFVIYKLPNNLKGTTAKNLIDVFLQTNYKKSGIRSELIDLESGSFISIGKFKNLESAIDFDSKNSSDMLLNKLYTNSSKYYISSENLDIFYISNGWQQYLSFYSKNYR